MAGHRVQLMGVVEGSIPSVSSGGTPTTTDMYKVEVTTGGPSGTAKITVTNTAGTDNLAANTIASGVAEALGTKGGTFTATFETLVKGDVWTIQQYATGEIDDPVAWVGNSKGSVVPIVTTSGGKVVCDVELEVQDIEIGAVELKNAATDERASIEAANTARTTATKVLATQAIDAAGAVLSTSALATAAKQPALGTGVMAGSAPVTVATDDTQFGAVGAAADADGNIHGQLRFIAEAFAALATDAKLDDIITALGLLALESGGNLAAIAGYLDTTAQAESMGAQLTAVGWTAALNVEGNLHHTVVLTLGGTDDADLAVQWSIDGTNWYTAYSTNDSAAGVYQYMFDGRVKYVRAGFTAEHGTTSTVDAYYYGGR